MADKSIPTIQQLAGNVGIGTSSPSTKLDVIGDTFVKGVIFAYAGSGGNQVGGITWDSTDDGILFLKASNVTKVSLNSNGVSYFNGGNVGIGTTSAGQALTLGANKNIRLDWGGGTDTTFEMFYDSDFRQGITFQGNARKMTIHNYSGDTTDTTITLHNGFVGIGTTSPGVTLDVNGSGIRITNSTPNVYFNNTTVQWKAYMPSNNFAINDAGTDVLTLGYNGAASYFSGCNVGIGTTAPVSKLHVAGAGNAAGGNILMGTANDSAAKWSYLTSTQYNSSTHPQGYALIGGFTSATTNTIVIGGSIYEANPSTEIQFWTHTAVSHSLGGSQRMTINSNGNVGIGSTSPSYKLDVVGSFNLGSNAYINYTATYPYTITVANTAGVGDIVLNAGAGSSGYETKINLQGGTSGYAQFSVASSERMRINASGNVGIGTTSPVGLLNLNNGDIWTNVTSTLRGIQFGFAGPSHGSYRAAVMGGAESYGGTDSGMLTFHTQNGYVTSSIPPERMRITSGGSVGIGTTSPGYKLDVNGDVKIGSYLYLASEGSGTVIGDISTGNYLRFLVSNGEKMRITSDGNIGIGTTSPVAKLHVSQSGNGALTTLILSDNARQLKLGRDQIQAYDLGGSATTMFISPDANVYMNSSSGFTYFGGNVGIGTTSPSATLTVSKAASNYMFDLENASEPLFRLRTYNHGTATAPGLAFTQGLYYGTTENASIKFYRGGGGTGGWLTFATSDGTEKMRIDAGGNVGIGTTSPASKLQVLGTGRTLNVVTTNDQAPASFGSSGYAVSTIGFYGIGSANDYNVRIGANVDAFVAYTNDTERMRITSGGNVGIGTTSPTDKLHVEGGRISVTSGGTYGLSLIASGSGGRGGIIQTKAGSDWNNAITINSSGNVGIGTTSPSSVLDVVGNIEYSGITKGSRGENKNFSSYDWCWHGKKYAGYISDIRTKLYEYYYTTTALTDEKYVNTYDADNNSRLSFDDESYTAIFTSHIHVKRQFTVSSVTLNGDDPYAIWVNGEYVSGADTCCSGVTYSYTFNVGWHRIDLIFSEGGGGDYVSMGWNPKDYTDYIDAMTPFGPLDFYSNQLTMRGGNVGVGTTNPAYKLDISGTIRATGDVIAYSDARVKDNVTTVENALDKVKSLRGVTYTRKDDDTKSLKVGVIAQEVLPILPEVVQQDNNGNYSVAYGNMVGVLIEAIKEQQRQIDDLKYLLQTINK